MRKKFFNQKLLRLHELIKINGTGTSAQLAEKFGCSPRTVRNMIGELKAEGFPIAYDKAKDTYSYSEEVKITFSVIIGGVEMSKILGGCGRNSEVEKFFSNNFPNGKNFAF